MIIKANPVEVKKAFFSLPLQQRSKLLEEFEDKLFAARFREIISILRLKAKTSSLKHITQVVKKVRKKLYGQEATSRR